MPAEENPHIINPASGFVASCGNRISPPKYKNGIGSTLPSTARALRINKILSQYSYRRGALNISLIQSFQADTIDTYAIAILPNLLKILDINPLPHFTLDKNSISLISDLKKKLQNYTGSMDNTDYNSVLYSYWMKELSEAMLKKTLPGDTERYYIMQSAEGEHFIGSMIRRWARNTDLSSEYCKRDENKALKTGHCLHNVLYSLLSAYKNVVGHYGKNEVKSKEYFFIRLIGNGNKGI